MWHKRKIEEGKQRIKDELDRVGESEGQKERLYTALKRISQLGDDETSSGRLKRYIYLVSALVHHFRHGGLTPRQVRNLVGLGDAILRIQGIQPSSSKLGFLYGDLHYMLSNIHYREGRLWESAWEQQVSFYLAQRAPTGGKGFRAFSISVQLLRLGHASLALKENERAEALSIPSQYLSHVRLERVRALRLMGEWDRAVSVAKSTWGEFRLVQDDVLDLQWEQLCADAQRTGSVDGIVLSVLKGHAHCAAKFITEAFLWTRVVRTRKWLQRYVGMRFFARGVRLDKKNLGAIHEFALILEQCYDSAIPIPLRLQRLGEALAQTSSLSTVHEELLVWASATRWLVRSRLYGFAALVQGEYRRLSLSLTDGRTTDGLGMMGDIETLLFSSDSPQPAQVLRLARATHR